MQTIEEALHLIEASTRPMPLECVALTEASRRTLAEDCFASSDSPPFDKALMDGFCFRSDDTAITGDHFRLPVSGCVTAGSPIPPAIRTGTAVQIMTGAPLPDGADVVVPIERTQPDGNPPQTVVVSADDVRAEANVLRKGAITVRGSQLVRAGQIVRAQEIAVLAESGFSGIAVARVPQIAVLATGDELVSVDEALQPGRIRNSNEPMLAAQIEAAGGAPIRLGIARDDRDALSAKILQGLEMDMLLLSGGVSAGSKDLVPSELAAAGVREVFHQVRMKPGKPLWFGIAETDESRPCLVFGLPGNPVSSMVCFEVFVRPAIDRMLGRVPRPDVFARLTKGHRVAGDRVVYWPCSTESNAEGMLLATPLDWKGSADLATPAQADALAIFSPRDTPYNAGENVKLLLLASRSR